MEFSVSSTKDNLEACRMQEEKTRVSRAESWYNDKNIPVNVFLVLTNAPVNGYNDKIK